MSSIAVLVLTSHLVMQHASPPAALGSDITEPVVVKLEFSERLKISVNIPRLKSDVLLAREVNGELERLRRQLMDAHRRELEQIRRQAKIDGFDPSYELCVNFDVCHFSEDLICLNTLQYEYTGGAHGNSTLGGLCYRMHRGQLEELSLDQLFRRDVDYVARLSDMVLADLKRQQASSVVSGQIRRLDSADLTGFVITSDGLTFAFSPYAVGCYAEGAFFVTLSFDQLRDIADPAGPLNSPGLLRRQESAPTTRPSASATPSRAG